MTNLTRRRALRWLAAGLYPGLSLLAACAPIAPSSPAAATSATSAPTPASGGPAVAPGAAQPLTKAGGTLRMGMVGDLTELEGQLIMPSTLDTLWQIYDRLTLYDDKMQPQPMLAESWELSPDVLKSSDSWRVKRMLCTFERASKYDGSGDTIAGVSAVRLG